MEMLVALAIFAVLTALAMQSFVGLSRAYVHLQSSGSEQLETARVHQILNRSVTSIPAYRSGPPPTAAELGLSIVVQDGYELLVWSPEGSVALHAMLDGTGHDLAIERSRFSGVVLRLVQSSGDGARTISSVRVRTNAPRDCRYDVVGRRCLAGIER